MPFIRNFTEPGAAVNYIQVGHRQTAVEYAIAGIKRQRDDNLVQFSGDQVFFALESTMGEWVIETLIQGAYMREYHLWEKDCKAYFGAFPKGPRSVVAKMREIFAHHGFAVPEDIFTAIDRMREMTNVMKHEEGLTLDHFVTEADYKSTIEAIEGFWEYIIPLENANHNKG